MLQGNPADGRYNERVPGLTLFAGKGGVGKTTLSAAYAVHRAQRRKGRVLVMSTDPAHSLGDVLQLRLGDRVRRVPLASRTAQLYAWQISAQKQFDKFLRAERESILDLAASATIFTREELEPLLDSTLPGMAEVAALLALSDLLEAKQYDEIVVDTAPLGHTLRLFSLPEHFARFLTFLETAASRDQALAAAFARKQIEPSPLIGKWAAMVDSVQEALSATHSRLMMVTTPETFALNETERAKAWLRDAAPRLEISGIVLNRTVATPGKCERCRRRARATASARKFLGMHFRGVPLAVAPDPGGPVLGAKALAAFGDHVFGGRALRMTTSVPRSRSPKLSDTQWPELDTPLSFTVGKGGVGKTTISAGLAFHQRRQHKQVPVTICSTDPAPSLDDVFEAKIGDRPVKVLNDSRLQALEIDSLSEFAEWSERVKQKISQALTGGSARGVQVDLSFERRLLTALLDVVPPGVDEIFATFRIMDLLSSESRVASSELRSAQGAERVASKRKSKAAGDRATQASPRLVMDMAPTGHALELLRTPARLLHWCRLLLKTLAPHRTLPLVLDLAVEVATVEQRARDLAALLRDPRRAEIWPVMLAEPLPDQETSRLLEALDELEAPSRTLFVNRVLAEQDTRGCRRCERERQWQLATLISLQRRYRGRTLYCVREFPREIAGAEGLKAFTRELWQLD
jgi:arsenite-transporting ATPase